MVSLNTHFSILEFFAVHLKKNHFVFVFVFFFFRCLMYYVVLMELLTSAIDRPYCWFNTWSYGILLNFVLQKCKRGLAAVGGEKV